MVSTFENKAILIIDDDVDMRRSIVAYLEDMNFIVYMASSGQEGIESFEKHRPDLVFTDLMMPVVDGLEVVREITRTSPETPVVVISGNSSVDYAIEAVRAGAWDYITKPILNFSIIDKICCQVLDRVVALKSELSSQNNIKRVVLNQDRQLTEISLLDNLTKLPLKKRIREKFNQLIINTNFSGELFVIVLELDNFKSINEKYGHEHSDLLISNLAERLKTLANPDVVVGRLGDDKFLVMVANNNNVMSSVSTVSALFDKPFIILSQDIHTSFTMGIASFPQDGEGIDTLMHCADIACASARTQGLNRHCFYSRELWEQIQSRITLESGLRKGLERNEFSIHYQPKLVAHCKRMAGMEALLRWKPTGSGQLISPMEFIHLLESSRQIIEVGSWMLEEACTQYMEWRRQGMGPLRLSVNISAVQFHSGNLTDIVKSTLDKTGMEPGLLCLELTESTVVKNIDETIASLRVLAELGIKISIDDFGTGYSSLSYLKNMPVDELKIDRSFVKNLPQDPPSVAIVRSVISIANELRMTVVAEGVETPEQAILLTSLGCNELQGYLFSKPLSKDTFFLWCQARGYCAR